MCTGEWQVNRLRDRCMFVLVAPQTAVNVFLPPTSREAAPGIWRLLLPSPGTGPPKERWPSPSSISSLWQPSTTLQLINQLTSILYKLLKYVFFPTVTWAPCESRDKEITFKNLDSSVFSLTSLSSRGVSVIGFVEKERRGLVLWVADLGSNKSGAATVRGN